MRRLWIGWSTLAVALTLWPASAEGCTAPNWLVGPLLAGARRQAEPRWVVRLLRIREAGTIYRLDAEALEELRRQDRVETVAEVSGEELSSP